MKLCLLLWALGGLVVSAWAQTATLSGTVRSKGEAIGGASVLVVGGTLGTVTDAGGNYRLTSVPAGQPLTVRVSSVGYENQEQTVTLTSGGLTALNFNLDEGAQFLDDVVVTGLSINARQRELGTSRANVSGETLKSLPSPTIENALVGRMAGVEAYTTDGAPGGGFRFRIRGGNSLLGSSDPLVIIDGIFMDNANRNTTSGGTGNTGSASFGMNNGNRALQQLNPEDIESIEVLKGAAAASLYGSRASNGVIVVKTKSGGKKKFGLSYGLDVGILQLSRGLEEYKTDWTPAEIDQWAGFQNARLAAASRLTQAQIDKFKTNPQTNWSEEPTRQGSFLRHTLNVNGGSRLFGYYATLTRSKTDGVAKGTNFETTGGRISLTSEPIKGLSVRVNAAYNHDDRRILPGGSPGFFIPNKWTVDAIQAPFITLSDQHAPFLSGIFGIASPDVYATIGKNLTYDRTVLSGNVNYKLTPNLSVDVNGGIDQSKIKSTTIYPKGAVPSPILFPNGRLDFDEENLTQRTLTVGLNHRWQINPGLYLKSAVGTQYDENERTYYYKRFNVYGGTGDNLDTTNYTGGLPGSVLRFNPIVRTFGIYINETIGIGEKLFVNLGGRADRSTAFIEQFFFYPRASLSYQAMKTLRFRASVGTSGIQPPPYQVNATYRVDGAGYDGSGGGYLFSNPGNKNLRPEQQTEFEAGLDANLLRGRLNVELTFYNKQFTSMLFNASAAPDIYNGLTRITRNVGAMYNRGVEFNVTAQVVQGKNFNWTLGLTGATLANKITKLNDPPKPELGGLFNVAQLRVGYPISGYWVGLAASDASTRTAYAGSPLPKLEASLNSVLSYKGLSLTTLFGGKWGFYRFNTTGRDLADPSKRMHVDYWNLPATDAATFYNDLSNWVQKADFLKLRQLTLAYSPKLNFKKFPLKTLTVAVTGANLFTWTKYRGGYDVESETSGSGGGNGWVRGVDAWELGPPRQVTGSLNIGF